MTITREIREKVVQMHLEGRGRNEIARLLNGQGPEWKVSEGTVGNIIRAYRHKHEQQSQQMSSNTAINTSTTFNTTDGSPFFTAHSIGDGQTVPSNSILANWPVSFKNTVNTDAISTGIGGPLTSFLKNTMTDSPSEGLNSPILQEPTFMSSEAQIDIKPTTNYSHVNSAPEEEEFEQDGSRPSLSNSENPSVTLGIDWDENHLTRFNKIMMDDKRYVQEEKRKLEEQRKMLYQERSFIEEQKMILEKREKKLAEVAELNPSAKLTPF